MKKLILIILAVLMLSGCELEIKSKDQLAECEELGVVTSVYYQPRGYRVDESWTGLAEFKDDTKQEYRVRYPVEIGSSIPFKTICEPLTPQQ